MEKKKLFEKLKRRFKALVLAGTLAGTATACGPSYYVGEEGLSSSVVTELETEGKTESKTDGKTESKTEGKTEGKTESKTESKTENKQDPTNANASVKTNNGGSTNNNTSGKTNTGSSNNNTSEKTNTGSSNNNTSGKTNTGSSNNNTSVKTNNGGSTNNNQGGRQQQSEQPKQQEQTQPQQPQTQPQQPQTQPQQPQTQPEQPVIRYDTRTDYVLEDLLSDIPMESEYAMYQIANEFGKELFNNCIHENQYGGSLGADESKALLVALNYDKGINNEALAYIFEFDSEEDFSHYCDNLNFAYYQYLYGTKVDFTKYTFDKNIGNYINYVSDLFIEYTNGNEEPLLTELDNYFAGNSEYSNNILIYYFMRNTQNPLNYYSPEIDEARQMYFDNIVSPAYNNFEPYKGMPYSK